MIIFVSFSVPAEIFTEEAHLGQSRFSCSYWSRTGNSSREPVLSRPASSTSFLSNWSVCMLSRTMCDARNTAATSVAVNDFQRTGQRLDAPILHRPRHLDGIPDQSESESYMWPNSSMNFPSKYI